MFTVNTPDGLPGKVFVDVRESDGYIYEVDFWLEKPESEESKSKLQVEYVPTGQLFETIDKMIKGELTESDCEILSKKYEKEEYRAWASWELAEAHNIIMGYMDPWQHHKGFIFRDDRKHLDSTFAKEQLKYDVLKMYRKANEITIDSSWPLNGEHEGEDEELVLWNRLAAEADKTNNGLLVINVRDIRLFKYCDCLQRIVKQEYPGFDFKGYVLLVIKDRNWNDVKKYVEKNGYAWDLDFMIKNWYRLY